MSKEDKVISASSSDALAILTAERINRLYNYKWTMRGNKLIDVKDMSDEHLNNTIRLLKRMDEDYKIIMECGATEADLY